MLGGRSLKRYRRPGNPCFGDVFIQGTRWQGVPVAPEEKAPTALIGIGSGCRTGGLEITPPLHIEQQSQGCAKSSPSWSSCLRWCSAASCCSAIAEAGPEFVVPAAGLGPPPQGGV